MTSIVVRVVIAAVIMGGVVEVISGLNLFLLIGLGVVVYGALVLGLRVIDQDEWALIFRLLRRFTPSAAKEA
jgi:hypothetical protein